MKNSIEGNYVISVLIQFLQYIISEYTLKKYLLKYYCTKTVVCYLNCSVLSEIEEKMYAIHITPNHELM